MSSAPDVVHLTTAHRPSDGRIFRKECMALHEAGIAVTLVAVAPADATQDGIPLVALPQHSDRFRRMLLGPVDALRCLKRLNPRIVHIHDPELIPIGLLWKKMSRGRVIFDSHEDLPKQVVGKPYLPSWSHRPVSWFARTLEKTADRCFDAVVVATPTIAENFSNKRVTLVQNFPWLRDFATPKQYPSPGEHLIAGYVGGISRGRGSATMVNIPVTTEGRTIVRLAGSVAPDAQNDIDGRAGVEFYGTLAGTEIPDFLAGIHVGLSVLEPLPNYLTAQATKMFEYMAAARPFIASNFPLWMELFDGWQCGFFVDPLNEKQIAKSLETIYSNPAAAQEMGARGRRAIQEQFNFEREGERLVKLTFELLAT